MFSRLLDKFRKKNESQMLLQMAKQLKEADESVNEIKVWDVNEACWRDTKKGMKKMFGKMYPNCVKKTKKKESVKGKSRLVDTILVWVLKVMVLLYGIVM